MEYAQRTPQCIVIILQYNITIVYITNLLLFPRVSCLIYSEKKNVFFRSSRVVRVKNSITRQ